jgi:hypothetical protein
VSQLLVGEIVDFLNRLGVDPTLFKLMTDTVPNNVYIIPNDQLTKLRVVTGDISSETWTFELKNGSRHLKANNGKRR